MTEIAELEKRMSALSDRELAQLLLLNAQSYTQVALEIAKTVAERRNLSPDALQAVLNVPVAPPTPDPGHAVERPRIRGWLVLPALGLVLSPLRILDDLVQTLRPPTDIALVAVVGAVDVILIVFCCIVAWRFFGKRRNAPALVIAYNITAFALTLLCGIFLALNYEIPGFSLWARVRAPLRVCLIWIPYFLVSKRVKRTFIND